METDSHEHDVEDLLRRVLDEARREGGRDLSGVHAAAWAGARRLRRRRRQRAALTGVGSGLVAATGCPARSQRGRHTASLTQSGHAPRQPPPS